VAKTTGVALKSNPLLNLIVLCGVRGRSGQKTAYEERQALYICGEYEGNTFIEQVEGIDPEDAIQTWLNTATASIRLKDRSSFLLRPQPLTGICNTWCTGFRDDQDIFFLINIIETAR
jgi:hypothetical protein